MYEYTDIKIIIHAGILSGLFILLHYIAVFILINVALYKRFKIRKGLFFIIFQYYFACLEVFEILLKMWVDFSFLCLGDFNRDYAESAGQVRLRWHLTILSSTHKLSQSLHLFGSSPVFSIPSEHAERSKARLPHSTSFVVSAYLRKGMKIRHGEVVK